MIGIIVLKLHYIRNSFDERLKPISGISTIGKYSYTPITFSSELKKLISASLNSIDFK